jgi:hypothetical protein
MRRLPHVLEIIESYPDDKYLPSFLVRGHAGGAVSHAHIASDVKDYNIRIVTMYIPEPGDSEQGFRTRRHKNEMPRV